MAEPWPVMGNEHLAAADEVFAVGGCARCAHPFAYDPYTVPSVYCDTTTGLPHTPDGTDRYRRQPLCPGCAARVAAAIRTGVPVTWPARAANPHRNTGDN